jgi:hypothetical protein
VHTENEGQWPLVTQLIHPAVLDGVLQKSIARLLRDD